MKLFGFSQKDIAQYRQVTESTVEKNIAKGMSMCRDYMRSVDAIPLDGYQDSRRMVFSFMSVTALLGMWISNTATVLMMLPIALVVLG